MVMWNHIGSVNESGHVCTDNWSVYLIIGIKIVK